MIELLEALEVPILSTGSSGFDRSAPLLGEGGFAEVRYSEVCEQDGSDESAAVIKELKQSTGNELRNVDHTQNIAANTITQAFIEVCTMKHPALTGNPNILQLLGTTTWAGSLSSSWGELCLVTEYADLGSLDVYLQKHPGTSWNLKSRLICDVAEGLESLHACDIVHNDIKCGNILLFSQHNPGNKRITAKISDFGCAVPLATTNQVKRRAATLLFSAPEAYSFECVVSPSRDIYCFGLLVFEIVTEASPFRNYHNQDDVIDLKQSTNFLKHISSLLDPCLRAMNMDAMTAASVNDIVAGTLRADVTKRVSNLSAIVNRLRLTLSTGSADLVRRGRPARNWKLILLGYKTFSSHLSPQQRNSCLGLPRHRSS